MRTRQNITLGCGPMAFIFVVSGILWAGVVLAIYGLWRLWV